MAIENAMPVEVRAAIEHLLRVAKDHKVIVVGFAFASEKPCFTNFGTCKDMGDIALYAELCSIAEDKIRKGKVLHEQVGPVQ